MIEKTIDTLSHLSDKLNQLVDLKENNVECKNKDFEEFLYILNKCEEQNSWFDAKNTLFCLKYWAKNLTKKALQEWILPYKLNFNVKKEQTIGIVMAGNIPLVGFHDLLCVLLTGHRALVKLSHNDKILTPYIYKLISEKDENLALKVTFTQEKFTNIDKIIATGSDNTARYFEYYFGKYPNIIRKNRNSIAVLTGKESKDELKGLASDIFTYYGLGCRSVSKVYIPENYDLDIIFEAIFPYADVMENQKYMNNYNYNKAVYLMSQANIVENGFFMLKQDLGFSSPISTLFYQRYSSQQELRDILNQEKDKIQCVVSSGFAENEVSFGSTQTPSLKMYADNIDTIEFLR